MTPYIRLADLRVHRGRVTGLDARPVFLPSSTLAHSPTLSLLAGCLLGGIWEVLYFLDLLLELFCRIRILEGPG